MKKIRIFKLSQREKDYYSMIDYKKPANVDKVCKDCGHKFSKNEYKCSNCGCDLTYYHNEFIKFKEEIKEYVDEIHRREYELFKRLKEFYKVENSLHNKIIKQIKKEKSIENKLNLYNIIVMLHKIK